MDLNWMSRTPDVIFSPHEFKFYFLWVVIDSLVFHGCFLFLPI